MALAYASLIAFIPVKKSLISCLLAISSFSFLVYSNFSSKFSLPFSISSSYSLTMRSILSLNSLHVFHNSTFHPSVPLSIAVGFKHWVLCNNLGYLHVLHSLSHSPFFPRVLNLSFSSSSLYSLTNIFVIFLNSLFVLLWVGWGILDSYKPF